jgi:hypothetical protein
LAMIPILLICMAILDGFVKSPDASLRFIPRHCGVQLSTPHSS